MNANKSSVLLLVLLGGCATSSINRVDEDNAARQSLLRDANRGDANAQFLLGESYCCGSGYYSTTEAVKWWCRASAQNHATASERLIEHLDGDIIETCEIHRHSDND